MVETVQEFLTPSIVLKNQNTFFKTYKLLQNYLETVALIKYSHSNLYTSVKKIINKQEIIIANKTHIYLGIYDGKIKPADREARGILYYSLAELKQEIRETPEIFTHDLQNLIEELEPEIKKFLEII